MTEFAVITLFTRPCSMNILAGKILQDMRKCTIFAFVASSSQLKLTQLSFQERLLFLLRRLLWSLQLFGCIELILLLLFLLELIVSRIVGVVIIVIKIVIAIVIAVVIERSHLLLLPLVGLLIVWLSLIFDKGLSLIALISCILLILIAITQVK